MIPRHRIDISWYDLLAGLAGCILPGNRMVTQRRLERDWGGDTALAALSVRSGFDAFLTALQLPAGSEVLVSAVTIRDMVTIIREHGLVPVPLDLNTATMGIEPASLETAVNDRTRAVVLAHLFGTRMDMSPIVDAAARNNLIIIEDCAQSYRADGYRGSASTDVALFSFGPIKTATALGGALMSFRDPGLALRVREIMQAWPVQARWLYALRICKYLLIKALGTRLLFTLFYQLCAVAGLDYDRVIYTSLRGFRADKVINEIRCQSSTGLLRLLYRRITDNALNRIIIARRIKTARTAIRYMTGIERPGSQAKANSYWVFPVLCATPGQAEILRNKLVQAGYDTTCSATSLRIVEPPAGHSGADPCRARGLLSRVLYLPVYEGVTDAEIRRMAELIRTTR